MDGKNYTVKPGDKLTTICAENPDLGYSNWEDLRDANIEKILQVGSEQMAAIAVGANVTRKPCGLTGHSIYPKHLIVGGVHYDEPGVPTIYPGTTLYLRNKPEPPAPDEPLERQEEKFTATEIHKKRWTGLEHQAPTPKLEIYTKGEPGAADITYTADMQSGSWSKLLGYSFSESVDALDGAFSFTVENEEVGEDGSTVFDIIPIRSIVKIYEGGERPVFVGIVRRRHLGMSMSQGVKRTITFTGKSIISCITEYTVSLDVRIQGVSDAVSKTKSLEDEIAKDGLTIKDFMKISWAHFKKVSESAGISTLGIADVIEKFIGSGDPEQFIKVTGKEQELRYNVAAIFYNAANNVISDVWRNILPKPVYELFSRCDDGEPKIIARQAPYGDPDNGNYDWAKLPIYRIAPISLTAYDLDQSDEEVYTAFATYIIGSALSKEFYMAVNQTGNDSTVEYTEKQKLYGFKPLEITFNGYDRQGNTRNGEIDSLTEAVKTLSKKASYWFSRLDDMYTGSITICTDFNEPETNPRVGCRAKFLGGEFYINKADHTWNYGGTPTIKLTLSRGMMYDENGKIRDSEGGIIKNVGRRFRELELEKT